MQNRCIGPALQALGLLMFTLNAAAANAQPMDLETTGVRLLLGVDDKEPVRWDGSVKLTVGEIRRIEAWRFRPDDAIIERSGWKTASHLLATPDKAPRRMSPTGVVLTLSVPRTAELEVETAQGKFRVSLGELVPGRRVPFLDGRVLVDAVAPAVQITSGEMENDFPAATTGADGTVWVAFVEHAHRGPADLQPLEKQPADFGFLIPQGGGDQVALMRFDGKNWSPPLAISQSGLDVWRPAVAVDGQGRVHVVWSQNVDGNWDLFEQVVDPKDFPKVSAQSPRRLTSDPGADVYAALAADKQGRVWVAWQGWRNCQADIWLMPLDAGAAATAPRPIQVTDSPADEWSPALAADSKGRLHVAYDTYAAGNYDVYLRTFADGKLSAPVAIAASSRFEASPSIVCDKEDRIWIAYEQRGAEWGKDTGPLAAVEGAPLYMRGAVVQVRVLVGGQLLQPAAELMKDFPQELQRLNSYPRIALDGSGRVWLLFRHRHEAVWGGNPAHMLVGGVWLEYATTFDGQQWSPPVFLAASDNLLDVRPALARTGSGRLLAIYPSDGRLRHEVIGSEAQRKIFFTGGGASVSGQAKNDLHAAALPMLPAAQPPALAAVGAEVHGPVGLPPDGPKQQGGRPIEFDAEPKGLHPQGAADVRRLRDYVIEAGGKKYRPLRGEFHRHTEISMDGGSDGSLEDMWRYALDAAQFDWIGNGDHDSGSGREYPWWIVQKTTEIFTAAPRFVPMFTYERSVPYPNGHRNAMFDRRGVRTCPRLLGDEPGGVSPDDAKMFYAYLNQLGGICASHTSGTGMGTDWHDNDPQAEPVVEIYQGDRNSYEALGGPRVARKQSEAIGGWRPLGMVWNALAMGYRLGFQSSSDHWSTHISYAVALAEDRTRPAILDAFRKRHCYAATDNILLDVRMGEHLMGDEFTQQGRGKPTLSVRIHGTAPLERVDVIKDFVCVYSLEPKQAATQFSWTDNDPRPGVSWYYVRVLQTDAQVAWASPIWVRVPPAK
jgi:hypothetical protein